MTTEELSHRLSLANSVKRNDYAVVMTQHRHNELIKEKGSPYRIFNQSMTTCCGHPLHIVVDRDDLIDTLEICSRDNQLVLFVN